jgi:hypothetical protein
MTAPLCVTPLCQPAKHQGSRRRLQQTGGYADLTATVTYPGNSEAGTSLIASCTAGNCTEGSTAVVVGGMVQDTALTQIPTPTVTLVRQPTPEGTPYVFVATYRQAGQSAAAYMTMGSSPQTAMSCTAVQQGVGVTVFTCTPRESHPAVVMTAYGPNPKDVNNRVQSSLTVVTSVNASE